MSSSKVMAALDAIAELFDTQWDNVPIAERLTVVDQLETLRRRGTALGHDLTLSLAREDISKLGDVPHRLIADRLRITPAEARRRIRDAEQLASRMTLAGQVLPPELPCTSKQWRTGVLDGEHLRAIQRFFAQLPAQIDVGTREAAEQFLADKATALRPDQLVQVADRLAAVINPDGVFTDADRARRRGFSWGRQGPDGMSEGRLTATPELRANLEAWFAKFAAPGMCDPSDQRPRVNEDASTEAAQRDSRSVAQRQHDALNALVRSQLGNPALGQHRGLPVTVIVSTTLKELESGCGQAVTGGGTLLPMSDVIRIASHSYHYLVIFDDVTGRPLYLGRTKRIASADQRIVLHVKDRGCSRPGCTAPGYRCEVHHVDEWTAGGVTNVDDLTFACKPDHQLLEEGWRTVKRRDGSTEWIPPPHLDTGQPRTNDYHHPERLLTGSQ
jgi:hypothetical protein